jgi:hypothetical protein
MAKGRPVLLLGVGGRLIALLIARRWSGRIPGICWWLFEPLDLRFQLPILLFQVIDSGNQGFGRLQQIGVGNLTG